MNAEWARALIAKVRLEMASRKRGGVAVGVGLAMAVAGGATLGCAKDDSKPDQKDTAQVQDVDGASDDLGEVDDVPDWGPIVDVYGVPEDLVQEVDDVQDWGPITDVYGVPEDFVQVDVPPADAYGVPVDVEEEAQPEEESP